MGVTIPDPSALAHLPLATLEAVLERITYANEATPHSPWQSRGARIALITVRQMGDVATIAWPLSISHFLTRNPSLLAVGRSAVVG
jgi:hypothetical protein